MGELDRNISIVKEVEISAGGVKAYKNELHDIVFHIPYRWTISEGEGDLLNVTMEPGLEEHNVQQQIERSSFIPLVLVGSE